MPVARCASAKRSGSTEAMETVAATSPATETAKAIMSGIPPWIRNRAATARANGEMR
ncbi:MAG TPA: hypothetical protein VID50_07330 [Candidatus Eisenbacteria bacterium]